MTNPVAKTFYNHRIFLMYKPEDYRKYLLGLVEQKWAPEERFTRMLGLMAWGTILVYRARMIPFDFNRRLKALVDDKGEFLEQNPTLPLSRALYRQELAMQLGIEAITRRPDVKERVRDVPLFSQYIYDTLYFLSYHHERGPTDFDKQGRQRAFEITPDRLRDHLWFLAQGSRNAQPSADFAPPEIIDFLFNSVLRSYIDLLLDPKRIRHETISYARQLPTGGELQRLWLRLADAVYPQPLIALAPPGAP